MNFDSKSSFLVKMKNENTSMQEGGVGGVFGANFQCENKCFKKIIIFTISSKKIAKKMKKNC
jgi:hypothetical protein